MSFYLRQQLWLTFFFLVSVAWAAPDLNQTADALEVLVHLQDAGYPNDGDLTLSQENLERALSELQQDLCLVPSVSLDLPTWQNLQNNRLSEAAVARLQAARREPLRLEAIPLIEKAEKLADCDRTTARSTTETAATLPASSATEMLAIPPDGLLPDTAVVAPPAVLPGRAFDSPNLPTFFWTQWALAELADRDAEFQWQLPFRTTASTPFQSALTAFAIKNNLFTGNNTEEALLNTIKPYLAAQLAKTPFPIVFPQAQTFSNSQLQKLAADHYQQPDFVPEKSTYSASETQAILQSFDAFSRLVFQEESETSRPERLGLGLGIQVLYNDVEPPLAIPHPEGAAASAGWNTPAWLYGLNQDIARRQVLENLKLEREQKITVHYAAGSGSKSLLLHVGYYPRPSLIAWQEGERLWIRIFTFRFNETADLLASALQNAEKKNVIFDLRYCNGGSFAEMLRALSHLLPEKSLLFGRYRDGKLEKKQMRLKVPYLPLGQATLLLSRYTASSAEIFALALRQQQKWPVLGESSYGKCTVQERQSLAKNWWAEISIMEIKDLNGVGCHGQGVVPDAIFRDTLFADAKTWEQRLREKSENHPDSEKNPEK
jgi:C-terminal processing protease CtpA/Prc